MFSTCGKWVFGSLFLAACILRSVESSNILVFICEDSKSHHIVYHPIIRELALRGHHVDYYTHLPLVNPPDNLTQIVMKGRQVSKKDDEFADISRVSRGNAVKSALYLRRYKVDRGEFCVRDPEVQELLASNKKYDMVIGEFYFLQEEWTVLTHKFNTVGVAVHALPDTSWVNSMSGFPDNPSYMINYFSGSSDRMNILEKLWNCVSFTALNLIEYYHVSRSYQAIADKYLLYDGWESRPPVWELSRDLALILINSHHSLGYPYPKAPQVKEILGVGVEQNPQPLTKELQDYMDSAEHGVILFSMGSMVRTSQLHMGGQYEALVNVLKNVKQKVIWKWTSKTNDELPNIPNIKMVSWFPQQSTLAHKNMKLFITHCGLGGVSEAVNYGIPLIGLPVFADQFRNAKLVSTSGFGVVMDLSNLTETSISWAINEVLDNPKYKTEAMRRSAMFRDRQRTPVDEAVYWIEYVLRYGKVLQPASVHMPFYQLYLLDVFGVLVVGMIVFFIAIRKIVRLVTSLLTRKQDDSTPTTESSTNSVQDHTKHE